MVREFSDPEGDLFSQMIARREGKRGGDSHSLVYYFAESRVESNAGELRNLDSYYVGVDTVDLKSLPDEYKRKSMPHLSQIFLGNTIMAIEETLISRSYSHYVYTSRINGSLSGTAWTGGVVVGSNVETPVEPNQMQAMYNAAKSDPTLAVFIESPVLMPAEMFALMDGLGLYGPVKLVALQDYKRKALKLVRTV